LPAELWDNFAMLPKPAVFLVVDRSVNCSAWAAVELSHPNWINQTCFNPPHRYAGRRLVLIMVRLLKDKRQRRTRDKRPGQDMANGQMVANAKNQQRQAVQPGSYFNDQQAGSSAARLRQALPADWPKQRLHAPGPNPQPERSASRSTSVTVHRVLASAVATATPYGYRYARIGGDIVSVRSL
jgi:hypothetical protein